MIKKSALVRALMQVAAEYNNNSHKLSMNTCPLCILYRDYEAYNCTCCPMRTAFKACGRRHCQPVECFINYGKARKYTNKGHMNKLEAVREFYYKAIARIRRMTVKELNASGAFDFLRDIDKKVGEKYGVCHEIGQWEI